jgi:hypothetical protein
VIGHSPGRRRLEPRSRIRQSLADCHMQQTDGIETSGSLLTLPPSDGRYGPLEHAPRVSRLRWDTLSQNQDDASLRLAGHGAGQI